MRRLTVLPATVAALSAILVLAAATPVASRAQPPPGCERLPAHQLTNGDPASVEGAVRLSVDALGVFGSGSEAGLGAPVVFNPLGPKPAADAAQSSGLYLSHLGRLLRDDCSEARMGLLSAGASSLVTETAEGSVLGLTVRLTQTLSPVIAGTSNLTQTYELRNASSGALDVAVVRHLEGDLRFDGLLADVAAASADGTRLSQFDADETAVSPNSLVAISGALDGRNVPDRWTMQPYGYLDTLLAHRGIPAADSGVVHGDANRDGVTDAPFDASATQQWSTRLEPGEARTFTTVTQFGGNRPPTAVSDLLLTDRDRPGAVNVLANDFDPDGEALQVATATPAAAHGSVSCAASGTCTYTPAPGYAGPDAFSYVVADGRGGTAVGAVSVSVAATPPPITGVTVNVEPVAGSVLVRLPGTDRFVPLSSLASVPVGSTLDTTAGRVRLTQARPEGTRESAEFYEGVFTVLQSRAAEAVAVLLLEGGDFSECGGASSYSAEKPKRKLWGAGKGKFRTRARFSAATVRGTTWFTADACDGTLTRVSEGSVTVTDFVRGVDVVVSAGQSYLATPARRGPAGRTCTITGTPGTDTLRGTHSRDVICGGGGNDRLLGLGGDDLLLGGAGKDALLGGNGRDELSGAAGNDRLDGGDDLDLLDGGGGHDRLAGGPGDDVLAGGPGRDHLAGGPGRDRLDGGGGNDFLIARDLGRGNDSVVGGPGRDRCRTDFIRVCP